MDSLNDAIEHLYSTFSKYRVSEEFVSCDCVNPHAAAELLSKSLQQLTFHDLKHYSRKALTTWGNAGDFRHFLPRLFELSIAHRDEFMDLAVLFGKLAHADWYSWPKREFDAVDTFLRSYWVDQLQQDVASPQVDTIDAVLCGEASAYKSVQPLLDIWLATDLISARKHLAAFILLNESDLLCKRRLMNPFWIRESPSYWEVMKWLSSGPLRGYLDKAELQEEFATARYQLEAIQAAFISTAESSN